MVVRLVFGGLCAGLRRRGQFRFRWSCQVPGEWVLRLGFEESGGGGGGGPVGAVKRAVLTCLGATC